MVLDMNVCVVVLVLGFFSGAFSSDPSPYKSLDESMGRTLLTLVVDLKKDLSYLRETVVEQGERIAKLELENAQLREVSEKTVQLEDALKIQEERIKKLEEENGELRWIVDLLTNAEEKVESQKDFFTNISTQESEIGNQDVQLPFQPNETHLKASLTDSSLGKTGDKKQTKNTIRATSDADLPHFLPLDAGKLGQRTVNNHISFSTYLSHTQDNIGAGQTIKFDRVITNDGNGYSPYTGVFTVPVTGTYVFFFTVASGGKDVTVVLKADSEVISSAVARPYRFNEHKDLQGSNMAVVHVQQGVSVWVDNLYDDASVYSHVIERWITFSGFYLY